MLNLQPTYNKFGASSPQFAEVGKAMYDAWFGSPAAISNQRQFTADEISSLMQYMWHEVQGWKAVVSDRDKKIDELKKKIKELSKTSGGK